MLQALFWDHDGVLVDTERLYFQATRELLAEVGVQLTQADYHRYLLVAGTGAWHLAAERGVAEAEIAQLRRRRDQRYASLLTAEEVVIPGVPQLLAALQPRARMAIVTSSKRAHFDAIHRHSGLSRYFELILAREDYGRSKPDPEPYRTALERMQLQPAQCLVIEDSERGLIAAKAAGLACWVIPSELTRASSFEHADRRFESHHALGEALSAALG